MMNVQKLNMFDKRNSMFFISPRGIYLLCWWILIPLSLVVSEKIDSPLLFFSVLLGLIGYLVFNKRLHWNVLQQWGILNLLFISTTVLTLIIGWIISAGSMTFKPEEMSWIYYIGFEYFPFEILNKLRRSTFLIPFFCLPPFILGHLVKIFIESEIKIIISNRTKWLFLTGWLCFIPYLVVLICAIKYTD